MKPPKNNREVSKFLGMTGWYQKFIPRYADICEPLYQIKKKGAKFNWSGEAQDSFDQIKRTLTEAPILQLPNFSEQFNLFTDASGVGIGAVLQQNQKPTAFASRTLNKAERNYTVTERECLAVIWALNKFKTFWTPTCESDYRSRSVNEVNQCAAGRKQVGKFMPKFEGPYKVLEIKGNNLVIWKNGRNITVNIDQVRVYRPRQSDTISSDSPVETLYDEQEVSHGSNRSHQGQFKEHRKNSRVKSIAGPSKLPDRRTATTTSGSRMEVSGRDNQTRQTRATTRRRNEQAEKPVRSNQTNTRRPCPYYLRSRIQEKDRIHEDLNNIEINGIPGSTFRRRSLRMEALNGDTVHRI
ncbi:retrovirus-related Pol polyprotein from transposon 297 [Trichonephila clavipes]|nr:retrovirus-related Pol polyprotein from transposon 297 [Trichonephila clavipes]